MIDSNKALAGTISALGALAFVVMLQLTLWGVFWINFVFGLLVVPLWFICSFIPDEFEEQTAKVNSTGFLVGLGLWILTIINRGFFNMILISLVGGLGFAVGCMIAMFIVGFLNRALEGRSDKKLSASADGKPLDVTVVGRLRKPAVK